MTYAHRNYAILAALTTLIRCTFGDFEHLVSKPESMTLATGYETLMSCEMNIQPDKFQWKFYPAPKNQPYNSKATILLSNATFSLIPENEYKVNRKTSELPVKVKNADVAGDYQCLAYYGASVVASVPWQITLARMGHLPPRTRAYVSVQAGNTVSWLCITPQSRPPAYVDYTKADKYVTSPFVGGRVRSMILANVTVADSGTYKCATTNTFERKDLDSVLELDVLRNGPMKAPDFVSKPIGEYTATKGSTLFLECSAIGKPIPKITWLKKQSQLPLDRMEMVPGGLIIKNVTSNDDGVYICNNNNSLGSVSHQITVKYNEEPSVDCFMNTTDIKQGENMDLECDVRGTPEPQIAWFLNGFTVRNDSAIEAIGNKIYFRPVEKRHAGNLQIFARNIVKTVYSIISIRVIPLTSSMDDMVTPIHNPRHNHKKSQNTRKPSKHKAAKMIPPSRPVISRVNDESVMVRWNVSNNNGLSIQFFKVQYKDLGSANHKDTYGGNKGWKTANTDIAPTQTAFEINGLKSDHIFKVRIAAVYVNNDSKMSPTSKKFHLRRLDFDEKNPLPICLITHVETVNHTAIKIYWDCPPYEVAIDGFYINYQIATRAGDDYMISTVEGEDVRSFVVDYLQPETSYDVKLQSFNQKLASDFSPLMKGRTGVSPVTMAPTTVPTFATANKSSKETSTTDTNIYIIIAGGVIAFALVITGVILLFVCRKWQRKKLSDNRDKPNVDHHIQADGNDYVVEPKTAPRSNGCALPGNRITITSNPLADADKNPTVIEMRNLANNNVRHQQDTPPGAPPAAEGHSAAPPPNSKEKNRHRKNLRGSGEDCSTGSNYV